MPIVQIPPPYRGPTQGTAQIRVEGETVLACLETVERKYPGFLAQVVDEDGGLHRFVKLFRNGDQLDAPSVLATRLAADDELEIVAAIAGG